VIVVIASSSAPVAFASCSSWSAAVDGDPTTRWASSWADSQTFAIDLGSSRTVGRAILRWEAAYAKAYRIEVSRDNSTWRTVFTATAANGAVDNAGFTATTARYVRFVGVQRATSYGYSLWELEVYAR